MLPFLPPGDAAHTTKCRDSPLRARCSSNVCLAIRNVLPALAVSLNRNVLMTRATTIRKPLTVAIVLMIAALAPLAAIIGFCTQMRCCSHAAETTLAVATDRGDCCTTITCYDAAPAKLTAAALSTPSATPAPLAVRSVGPRVALRLAHTFTDTSPPRAVADRLAILSLLLI